jgi:hypothetical protein
VAKRTRYAEYENAYANYRFELSPEGILLMQCHTNGGSLVWDWKATTRWPTPSPTSPATVRSGA